MWILYGIEKYLLEEHNDGSISVGTKRDALATFDTEKDGLDYVESSKLRSYNKMAPVGNPETQFADDSLLSGFHLAQVEPKNALPHMPPLSQ